MKDIDVVVVNWNAGNQILRCIQSIKKYSKGYVSKIIIVDNASTDGSDNAVASIKGVQLKRNAENFGFAKACNIGANLSDAEFILFLNPDAELLEKSLTQAIQYLQNPKYSQVGIVGVQLVDKDGHVSRSCARFPTATKLLMQSLGVDKLLPQLGSTMREWDHKSDQYVDQLIGAFFLVRRSLFDKLNGFDERFFVYFEEVDFSLRALNAGWKSMYLANSQAFHLGGGTSNQIKARRLFYFLRSRIQYTFKHFRKHEVLLVMVATLLIEPVSRIGYAFVKRSSNGVRETISAYKMIWKWFIKANITQAKQ